MSSRKDKLLESAQKFIAKGQLDRAIKDYEQIVALDQGDIRHRQRLAELLVRANRKDLAIAEYEAIGKHYSNHSFYLKAIAVYKQIQKLDPDNINTTLSLAALNEKQGLIGNALAEYNVAVNHYLKAGLTSDAIKVIEKMLAADPENLNTQLKFAETYFAAGLIDKAYREFTQLALFLRKRGDESAFSRVCERVQTLFPDKKEFALDILAIQVEGEDADAAAHALRKLVEDEKDNLRAWQLLASACEKAGDSASRKSVLREMIEQFPYEVSPVETLIQLALDEGDRDGASELLNAHEVRFRMNGAAEALERLSARLRAIAPRDDEGGGEEGIPAASGTVDSTPEDRAALAPEEAATPQTEEETAVSSPPLVPAEGGEETPAGLHGEMAWEEEIDLSLLEEETGTFPAGEAPAVVPPGEEEGEELPLDQYGEIDLSTAGAAEESPYGEFELATGGARDGEPEVPHEEEMFLEADELTEIDLEIEERETPFPDELEFGTESFPGAGETPLAGRPGLPGLGEQLTEFKKGIDQQLDREDTEAHYDLGIAYKEMGLFDEAIAEFRSAAADPIRRFDCLTLEGVCYRDKGDFARAEEIFTDALSRTGLSPEEHLSLTYELALLCETAGKQDDALRLYQEVRAMNAGFRDVMQKVIQLQGGVGAEEHEDAELLELDVEEFE